MRKGFLIYKEIRKYFPIYEEAVSHIWLCNCSILNFLIYEEIFFFLSVCSQIRLGGNYSRRFIHLSSCGWDLAECGWDLAECGRDRSECGRDLAESGWDLAESGWDLAECGWDLAECGWDLAEWLERLTANAKVATVLVRSQHPAIHWNLRGGWWSSVEKKWRSLKKSKKSF